jgi:tetratricopeptide (TPR) repeat protein
MELTIEQALQQGVTAHKEGKLEEAERLYLAILQSQPAHPDANHNLGIIAVSVNKTDVALPLFKTALEANPKIEQFWLSYIDALIKENQLETAQSALTEGRNTGLVSDKFDALEAQLTQIKQAKGQSANDMSPSQSSLNNLLEHYQNGRYDETEKLAMSITQEFPKHQFGWKVLGAVLGQTGRNSEAIKAIQTAVTISPQDTETHYNLGNTLKELGRLEEAEASYIEAIGLKPDFPEAHYNLGYTLSKLGRLEEAEASYKQAIVLKPDFSEAHSNLGGTLQDLGRLEEAEASYTQAIALKPDYVEAHYNLGITLQKLGRLDEAEVSYTQAIVFKPDYAEAHSNLGATLQELGRLDEAEASYTQAIVLKPDYAEAHSNLGTTLKELGRLDEAEVSYSQAIVLKSDYAEAYRNLAITLQNLNRWDEAEVSYSQAIFLKPDYDDALIKRGQLLLKRNEFERALRDFEFCNNHRDSILYALIALYALGRIDEMYVKFNTHFEMDDVNIGLEAFSSFIYEKEKRDTGHYFCRNPMDFLYFSNLATHIEDPTSFTEGLIEDLRKKPVNWNPSSTSTNNGFQGRHNLFHNPRGKIRNLQSIIMHELVLYYQKFKNESCSYIQKWPSQKHLVGWHIILKQHGYQTPHIHTGGWLSGVIYLKLVPPLGKDEGAIEFSLNGENYTDSNSPKLVYQPELGDIVFFPSSLHHRTIPFTTDTDRIIVSFDLMPKEAKH